MNARKYFKRLFEHRSHARHVLAAAQRSFVTQVDSFVARWLARAAANAVSAQRLFEADRKPAPALGGGLNLVVSSPNWNESP